MIGPARDKNFLHVSHPVLHTELKIR